MEARYDSNAASSGIDTRYVVAEHVFDHRDTSNGTASHSRMYAIRTPIAFAPSPTREPNCADFT